MACINRAVKPSKTSGEPLEVYELVTIPMPKASPGNVVVRVVMRPVNPTDLLVLRAGFWAGAKLEDVVAGSEGVGLVHELGEGVTKVKVGQRVIPLIWNRYYPHGYGLWRDYVEVPEVDLVPVPDNIPDEIAAQFIINPWTAYGLLNLLNIPKGGYFLQTAAGSVLGRQMIELAHYYGIKSINVIRSEKWIEPLTALGADYVINSSTEDVEARVKEITGGQGAYGAVDAVAGESTRILGSSVRPGGSVLVYGMLSALHVILDIKDLMRKVNIGLWLVDDYSYDLAKRHETVEAVMNLLSKKIINPFCGKVYPLEDFKEAMKESETVGHDGKPLLSSY